MIRRHVVVVGGGILGTAAAYFLATDASFEGRITVVEADSTYAYSATRRAAGAIRQQFNAAVNVELARHSYEFFAHLGKHLGVDARAADVQFTERGYLVLAPDGQRERLRRACALQRSLGVNVAFLTPEEIETRMPWFKAEAVAAGSLGLSGEGWFESMAVLSAMRRRAETLGVRYIEAEVVAMRLEDDCIAAVTFGDGSQLSADVVVNAAGAKAGVVGRMAGVEMPIQSRKRCAFVFRSASAVPLFHNLVDTTFAQRGVYVRPYGENYLAVTSPDPDQDPETFDFDVQQHLFGEIVRPALARRVKGFEELTLVDSWAGHYEFNTFDQNGFMGWHPDVGNLALLCGFSGHGLMHAPAAGRGIAELIARGGYRTIDLSPLGFERVRENRPFDDPQASELQKVE